MVTALAVWTLCQQPVEKLMALFAIHPDVWTDSHY